MWDLTTAKTVLKIVSTDTTQDVAIQKDMDYVLATVEKLLGRGLLLARQTDTFYNVDTKKILLSRYPIRRVYTINGKITSNDLVIHHRVGWIETYGAYYSGQGRTVCVDYEGGFGNLPDDLESTLWEAMQTVWKNSDHATGARLPGSVGTTVAGSGDVSRLSLADFGSVAFDVGSSVVGGDAVNLSAAQQAKYGWLSPWAYILETYRSEAAPGTAFA